MSTDYVLLKDRAPSTVKRAMKKIGLQIAKEDKNSFCITDGDVYLWCYTGEHKGKKWCNFTRYGGNYAAEEQILEPLCEELDVGFLSEYDDEYPAFMGFDDDIEEEDEDN